MQEEVIKFIKGYDFMRLGQAVGRHQWQAAAMTIRRMEMQAKNPELECFVRPFAGIRQAIMRRDEREAKQILATVTARRVRMLEQIRKEQEIRIRTASMEDLAGVAAVEAECFPAAEAAAEKEFAARLEVYPDHFWLLERGGVLIGFVNGMVTDEPDLRDEMYENAKLHKPEGEWQMIFGVNTRPEFRRRGYAEQMLCRVIADAKEQGRKGVVLTCKEKLIHYYEKFGFINEGVSESVHGNVTWYQMRLRFGDNV